MATTPSLHVVAFEESQQFQATEPIFHGFLGCDQHDHQILIFAVEGRGPTFSAQPASTVSDQDWQTCGLKKGSIFFIRQFL